MRRGAAGNTRGVRGARSAAVAAVVLALPTCTQTVGEGDPDLDAARSFDRHPLYWVGER